MGGCTRKGNGPENSSMFFRRVPSILKQDATYNDNITGKRQLAVWNESILTIILADFSANQDAIALQKRRI